MGEQGAKMNFTKFIREIFTSKAAVDLTPQPRMPAPQTLVETANPRSDDHLQSILQNEGLQAYGYERDRLAEMDRYLPQSPTSRAPKP